MKTFHICTLSNRVAQYRAMRESFLAAGFDEIRCSYELFDNSEQNRYEPYAAINRAIASCNARYLIVCHQDVLLNQGDGFDKLLSEIESVSKKDPRWAVLGNAGINRRYKSVFRITDYYRPNGATAKLPHRVFGLDENFLLIDPRANVTCSPELSGFHFYGHDICLRATKKGRTSYVIDFHIEHLGRGLLDKSFWEIHDQFQALWQKEYHCTLYKTVTGVHIFLSKYATVRAVFARTPIATRLNRPRVERLLSYLGFSPI